MLKKVKISRMGPVRKLSVLIRFRLGRRQRLARQPFRRPGLLLQLPVGEAFEGRLVRAVNGGAPARRKCAASSRANIAGRRVRKPMLDPPDGLGDRVQAGSSMAVAAGMALTRIKGLMGI
jgi:hypothetical protein